MLKSKVSEYKRYSENRSLSYSLPSLLIHTPVLLREIVEFLPLRKGAIVVDATLGLGGHAQAMLQKIGPTGKLFGFDWDARNRELAKKNLAEFENITFLPFSFSHIREELRKKGVKKVDAFLFDLGISSAHLDDAQRGFSYRFSAPLDLRMDTTKSQTAADILAEKSEQELADIFFQYGEEKGSRSIAKAICTAKKTAPIRTTTELFAIIKNVHPITAKKTASRIFQALRIVVNGEMEEIKSALPQACEMLTDGGRIAVITFHSLEDRLVKNIFREKHMFRDKNGKKVWQRVNKHVIIPSDTETAENPRARSAKLRILEKIPS